MSAFFVASCASSGPTRFDPGSYSSILRDSFPGRKPTSLSKPLQAEDALPVFYSKTLGIKDASWEAIELSESLRLPGGKPVPLYYNSHLIRARSARSGTMYFRPVDTTTGCTSGCTPVVFHLVLTEDGRVRQILEDPAYPLRKVHHQTFSAEDKKRALETAQRLPEALKYVNDPAQLTDANSEFPPQTWSAFKPTLVPGGAYTSYRIFEAAIKSHAALNPSDGELVRAKELEEAFLQEAQALRSADEARALIQRRMSELDDHRLPPMYRGILLSSLLEMAARVVRVDYRESDRDWFLGVFLSKTVRNYGRRAFCGWLVEASVSERLSPWVLSAFERRSELPSCEESFDRSIHFLAAQTAGRAELAAELARGLDFSARPEFLRSDPKLLESFARAAREAGKTSEALRLTLELSVRYPKFRFQGPRPDTDVGSQTLREQIEAQYRAELTRGFLNPPREIEFVSAHRGLNYEELGAVRLPVSGAGPKLYVFFASWCPYCESKLKQWVQAGFSQEFWSSIELVEILPRPDQVTLEDFCRKTGMSASRFANKCLRAARLTREPDHAAFLDRLEVHQIPGAILTDSQGRVVSTKVDLQASPYADLERDLRWMLDSVTSDR